MTKIYAEKKAEIMNDISVSYWCKKAIEELDRRDILDALNDLELLNKTLKLKINNDLSYE